LGELEIPKKIWPLLGFEEMRIKLWVDQRVFSEADNLQNGDFILILNYILRNKWLSTVSALRSR
jgi:hypothetical protein